MEEKYSNTKGKHTHGVCMNLLKYLLQRMSSPVARVNDTPIPADTILISI